MRTPTADFTPHDVDLLLMKGSHTPVPFIFEATDFSTYGTATFRWAERSGSERKQKEGASVQTLTGTVSYVNPDSTIEVTFDDTAWTDVGTATAGLFELEILDPSTNTVKLATGLIDFEETLA